MSETIKPVVTGVIGAGAISDAYLTNLRGQFSDIIHVKAISAGHGRRPRGRARLHPAHGEWRGGHPA